MKKERFYYLDSLRGLLLLNMIVYHAIWDLVYLFDFDWGWFEGRGASFWQCFVGSLFVFLSGYCWKLGSRPFSRGSEVLVSGILITAVTAIYLPQQLVLFGILTLLGSCMLLMIPLDLVLRKVNCVAGLLVSILLFVVTKDLNAGFFAWIKLPTQLYQGILTAYFGFPGASFSSVDYYSLFPWMFLFVAGYFAFHISVPKNDSFFHIKPLDFLGKHSLLIYMIHQPVLYGVFSILL